MASTALRPSAPFTASSTRAWSADRNTFTSRNSAKKMNSPLTPIRNVPWAPCAAKVRSASARNGASPASSAGVERALVLDAADATQKPRHPDGGTAQDPGCHLQRQEDEHGEVVERVVADGDRNARSNSSRRPRCASDTTVAVTVVPMLAPITIGMALASGNGFSGAATSATIIDVVTDELWTSVVASRPTTRPTNGFSVAAKKLWIRSSPSSRNPEPRPLTPSRKKNSSSRTAAKRGNRRTPNPQANVRT